MFAKKNVKYPSIFSRQIEAIVFINLQIFRNLRGFENREISLRFPSFSRGILISHMTRLHVNQSRACGRTFDGLQNLNRSFSPHETEHRSYTEKKHSVIDVNSFKVIFST